MKKMLKLKGKLQILLKQIDRQESVLNQSMNAYPLIEQQPSQPVTVFNENGSKINGPQLIEFNDDKMNGINSSEDDSSISGNENLSESEEDDA